VAVYPVTLRRSLSFPLARENHAKNTGRAEEY